MLLLVPECRTYQNLVEKVKTYRNLVEKVGTKIEHFDPGCISYQAQIIFYLYFILLGVGSGVSSYDTFGWVPCLMLTLFVSGFLNYSLGLKSRIVGHIRRLLTNIFVPDFPLSFSGIFFEPKG